MAASPSLEELDERLMAGYRRNVRTGISAYAWVQQEYTRQMKTMPEQASAWLLATVQEYAGESYRVDVGGPVVSLLAFTDRGLNFLFDASADRVLLISAVSKATASGTRDNSYHAGAPRPPTRFDKGHGISHAQGGFEGGPNYFHQASTLNRSLSSNGKLWRSIERYMAANPGMPAFVRLVWGRGNPSDAMPREVEYVLIPKDGQIRSAVFPNQN